MKLIAIVVLALVAVSYSVEVEPIKTIRSDYQQQPEGSYVFGFETENGIVRDETGELKDALDEDNKPHTVVVMRGSYSYPGEDGKPVNIIYTADELGFRAEGDTIPKIVSRR